MRRVWIGLGLGAAVLAGTALFYRNEILATWRLSQLFEANEILHNFQHMDELFPARVVPAGGTVRPFARGNFELPETFDYAASTYDTEAFLEATSTTGLIVIQDDVILLERYERGHSESGRHIAWSVSKSVVSALLGIAVGEGLVRDIEQPVTDYVPELAGSGYDGVRMKDVLQMSSGVGFNEDYGNPNSDINRMGRVLGLGGTLLEFAGTLKRVRPPGTVRHYVSIDTQVLGMILVRATGRDLADYTSEKLWRPLGAESDAYWILDGSGMEMAFGGFNASLRDFARIGQLYLHDGEWNGAQIVPRDWVRASVTPDAPHLMPGPENGGDDPMGYGYHWWIPADAHGEFMALGVYDQMIYVDPRHHLVIAKNSANIDFQQNDFEPTNEHVALFRKIAADLERQAAAGPR